MGSSRRARTRYTQLQARLFSSNGINTHKEKVSEKTQLELFGSPTRLPVAVVPVTYHGNSIAVSPVVTLSLIIPDDCFDCACLWAKYEAATFAQAKVDNALDRAKLLHDHSSIRRFTLEACDVAARRETARAILRQHQNADHQHADSVSGDSSLREESARHGAEEPGFMASRSAAFAGLENPR